MFQIERVKRNEIGYWLHSHINPAEVEFIEQLPEAQGMELIFISMEENVSTEEYEKFKKDQNVSDWIPQINEEDDNWFLVGIYETEFGPEACFVKPLDTDKVFFYEKQIKMDYQINLK
ncbi:MAG TPA: hypothetical protein PKY82_02465 [Pyrinomonadaceae bacterium]|nr:hypothetical protein [Pyrinomonadaceae bacterium]